MESLELIEQINKLTRDQALEAAGFISDVITEGDEPNIDAESKLKSITDEPYKNLEEIEQMARLLLMKAAMLEEYRNDVKSAIEGAGKKQFILGGTEIVALAAISLCALHVVLSKAKSYEGKTTKIYKDKETGETVVEIKEEVKYGISGTLVSILKAIGFSS